MSSAMSSSSSSSSSPTCVFPSPLASRDAGDATRELTASEVAFWEANGYVAVANAVPVALCAEIASTVKRFVGAAESWYANELDIYEDEVGGKKPHHGPCGMVQLSHHRTLWRMRQWPRVHGIFADLYGTEKLWVTTDRAHFKPPENSKKFPKWSDAGPVHSGLHWDTAGDVIPFAIQGVLYLEDTAEDQGALRVVPGSMTDVPKLRERLRLCKDDDDDDALLPFKATAVAGAAGTLVCWHSGVLHGPSRNVAQQPRVSAYVAMLPVDAGPFLPPGVPNDAPLNLADAGTCAFDDPERRREGLERQTRARRAQRWRERLPLLDEDPKESDLLLSDPNFFRGDDELEPFNDLSPLGRKLVGLDDW